MKSDFTYHRLGKLLLINAIIALVFCIIASPPFEATAIWIRTFFLDYFTYAFLISSLLSGGINRLIEFSSRRFSWLDAPFKRLVFDLVAVIAYSFVMSFIITAVYSLFVWKFGTVDNMGWMKLVKSTIFPVLIALGFTFFFTSRSFLSEWKYAALETEKMKTERLAGQYQGLKDQLNPHFLFNSLNVLSNLVYEDADKSNEFIQKLSNIYRYVLDVQYERLIDLDKEITFAKSYLDLQKLRFGEKLQYEIKIEEGLERSIPPLSLQLLLENAVKHNIATSASPLKIEIFTPDNTYALPYGRRLVVRNNLQKRDSPGIESGIGLKNIKERYRFFTERKIEISEADNTFSVSIPLIESES